MNNVVYFLGIYDHFPNYINYTIPSVKKYAQQVGADVVFKHLPNQKLLEKNQEKFKHLDIKYEPLRNRDYWETFVVKKMLQRCWYKFSVMHDFYESNYDKALVLDLDILIHKKCPNIFQDIQNNFIISQCDKHLIRAYTGPLLEVAKKRKDETMISKLKKEPYLFNGGLWGCDKNLVNKFIEYIIPPDKSINHFADQGLMTYKLLESNLNFKVLPPKIHANPNLVDFLPMFSHFTCASHKSDISLFLESNPDSYF
jgi:hypothetical protein